MYVVAWQFEVRPEAVGTFESEYGPEGTWARLFRKGRGYIRTELTRDTTNPTIFTTSDYWESEEAYIEFKTAFRGEYEANDRELESLTIAERFLGFTPALNGGAMNDPRYPIGKYSLTSAVTPQQRKEWIAQIAEAPQRLRAAVAGLDDKQLDTPYREGGWTVRQVAHHIPDSHVNSYMRYRLALTEESPTIRPYEEDRWAELPDAKSAPVEVSLALLEALHRRWVLLLESMSESDFTRTFHHPEHGKSLTLDWATGMYAWHGRHHVAHITSLRQRMGW